MLKKISSLFAALLLLPMLIQAFSPGFNKEEMRDMIAICNSFTFIDLYKSDEAIIPRVTTRFILREYLEWITAIRFTKTVMLLL
ncbi:MAG: hypothetical protein R2829_07170 [Bacteroidia bacterium]